MELQLLHATIVSKGGTMSVETLMSLLSRNKDVLFSNVTRGVWTLSDEGRARMLAMRHGHILPAAARPEAPAKPA
jgi:hypothetical protein